MVNAIFFRSLELNNTQKELVLKGLYPEGSFFRWDVIKGYRFFVATPYYKMEPCMHMATNGGNIIQCHHRKLSSSWLAYCYFFISLHYSF